jgi:hypothetical protein
MRARGQQRLDARAHRLAIGARRKAQSDAVQLPQAVQRHCAVAISVSATIARRARGGQRADHFELDGIETREQHQPAAGAQPQPLRRACDSSTVSGRRSSPTSSADARTARAAAAPRATGRAPPRGSRRRPRVPPRARAPGSRRRHRQARERRIERFGKTGAPAAHLEVRLARERAHARGQLADRGAVDEVHAEGERHAERHAATDSSRARAPVREAGVEGEEEAHAAVRYRPYCLSTCPGPRSSAA